MSVQLSTSKDRAFIIVKENLQNYMLYSCIAAKNPPGFQELKENYDAYVNEQKSFLAKYLERSFASFMKSRICLNDERAKSTKQCGAESPWTAWSFDNFEI